MESTERGWSWQDLYNDVAKMFLDPTYRDKTHGPECCHLTWHTCGTYSIDDLTGGSNHATVQFKPECDHLVNSFLGETRGVLEPLTEKYPELKTRHGDLWTIAGVAAVQELGGPIIKWKPGRNDGTPADCVPEGRLPLGGEDNNTMREIFRSKGLNDQEVVALLGVHCMAKCHVDRSGFDGQWTRSAPQFSNGFFKELIRRKWVVRKWDGLKQYESTDADAKGLLMLPTDINLLEDPEFKKWIEVYAADEERFFKDFAAVYQKIMNFNVPFPEGTPEYTFKPLKDQVENEPEVSTEILAVGGAMLAAIACIAIEEGE